MSAVFLLGVRGLVRRSPGLGRVFALAYVVGRREKAVLAVRAAVRGVACSRRHGLRLLGVVRSRIDIWTIRQAHGGNSGRRSQPAFALSFALRRTRPRSSRPLYVIAFAFARGLARVLWVPGSYRVVESRALGLRRAARLGRSQRGRLRLLRDRRARNLYAIYVLGRAYLRGQREVLPAFATSLLVIAALANDVALATGLVRNTVAVLPHVFMLYALGAAGTLLFRYRVAAGQLEQTATSLQQRTEELRHSYAELAQVHSEWSPRSSWLPSASWLRPCPRGSKPAGGDRQRPWLACVAPGSARRTDDAARHRRRGGGGGSNRLVTDLCASARRVNVKRSPVSLVSSPTAAAPAWAKRRHSGTSLASIPACR